MGKIPIQDLAKQMRISYQDLVFKLRSIGVRVDGENAAIDTEIISAILQGKKLPQPKEVILRDEPVAAAARKGQAQAPRRPAVNPLKPARPRTLIQSVDRIQTLPTMERPAPSGADVEHEPERVTDFQMETAPQVSESGPASVEVEGLAAPPSAAPPSAAAAIASASASPAAPAVLAAAPAAPSATTTAPAAPEKPRTGARLISRPTPGSPYIRPTPPTPYGQRSGPRPSGPGSGPRPGGPGSGPRPSGPGGPGGPGNRPYGARPSGPGGGGSMGRPGGPPMGRPGGPRPDRPSGPGMGPRPGGPRPGGPMRPGVGAPPPPVGRRPDDRRSAADIEAERLREDKKKRAKKATGPREVSEDHFTAFRMGSLREIEEAQEAADIPTSGRRRRRIDRREDERVAGPKTMPFREAAPGAPVTISEGMTVREFAEKLGIKAKDMIKDLFQRGIMANINHVIEPELAEKMAASLGVETMVVSFEEEVQLKQEASTSSAAGPKVTRAPVVTIMGHVDHGKTSLLDAIRSSRLTEAEHGGITQHIGAYHVEVHGRSIVFLDTPGHEAFTMMRARGARATDIVVLVVGADDGVMPQTLEAIDHARAAKVPIVVALNKIDKDNANPDRVKKQLADHGLLVEDWGGEVVAVPISATKRTGITELLEMILLTTDILDLKASPEIPAQGTVLEARKDIGRGIVATVLVQDGTLKAGDIFVAGATWGRVRAMADDVGARVSSVGPSSAVEVTGFSELPEAGDLFQIVEDEIRARSISEFRKQEQRKRQLTPTAGKLSLEQLFDRIQGGELKELPVIIKGDVQGSVEVLKETVEKASTDKVKVRVILASAGAISTNDVLLAAASGAIVIGFNVRPERNAVELAAKEGVDIRLHTIIYELLDELKKAMTGLLEPVFQEQAKGRAEVRDIFKVPKVGMVAGCHVIDGTVPRNAQVRLLRDNVVVYDGKISSLRRFKDDASEVRAGFDCGISLERFQDVKPGDIIEAYVRQQMAATL